MNGFMFSRIRPIRAALFALFLCSAPAVLVMPAVPVQAQAQAQTQTSDLDRAVAALRGISTMRADFVQTDRNGQSVSGVLTLKQPGKIRFAYEKSVPMLIVSDGRTLTMVDYEVRQVQRWPIKNSPLGALLNPTADISRYGKLNPTGNDGVISIEVRDPKRPEYGVITMIFLAKPSAPGGLELANWVALDSQNKRTTIRLSNHQYGVSVPDNAFTFRDPRNTGRR